MGPFGLRPYGQPQGGGKLLDAFQGNAQAFTQGDEPTEGNEFKVVLGT